jgi:hypothetical protein
MCHEEISNLWPNGEVDTEKMRVRRQKKRVQQFRLTCLQHSRLQWFPGGQQNGETYLQELRDRTRDERLHLHVGVGPHGGRQHHLDFLPTCNDRATSNENPFRRLFLPQHGKASKERTAPSAGTKTRGRRRDCLGMSRSAISKAASRLVLISIPLDSNLDT